MIMSDGEGAVKSLVDELEKLGVEVDVSGAGGHVAKIERKILIIRERVRCHVAYYLPSVHTVDSRYRHARTVLYIQAELRTGRITGMGPEPTRSIHWKEARW